MQTFAHYTLLPILTAATLIGTGLRSQDSLAASPYGASSVSWQSVSGVLHLSLGQPQGATPVLRISGGQAGMPVSLVFGLSRTETALPGGGTLLVGGIQEVRRACFDAQGNHSQVLDGARLADLDKFFVQAVQIGADGAAFSAALEVVARKETSTEPVTTPEAPGEIVVEEFAGLLEKGALTSAINLALNSDGDSLSFDFDGCLEVPVYACISAGGKVAFKAAVERGSEGSRTWYDLKIGRDVAASASVGVGVLGANASAGVGGDLIWRFSTPAQVARGIKAMIILKAVDDRLEAACLAIDTTFAKDDRAIELARRTVDTLRRRFRSFRAGQQSPLVKRAQKRLDALRARRRAAIDRARKVARKWIHWVAAERTFLTESLFGFELRRTISAGASAGLSFGTKDAAGKTTSSSTFANLGIQGSAGMERTILFQQGYDRKTKTFSYTNKIVSTKSVNVAGGCDIGGTATGKRVLEMSQEMQVAFDGSQRHESDTFVRLTLDGSAAVVVGVVLTGQAGIGGEIQLEMKGSDLLSYGKDAIGILMGDDDGKLIQLLRTLPVKLSACGRYDAGIAVGFGFELTGQFKAGIGASVMMTDKATPIVYEGGASIENFVKKLGSGLMQGRQPKSRSKLERVLAEVARVMSH